RELARMLPAEHNRAAALLSGSGFMVGSYQLDPARLAAFVERIVRDSAAAASAAGLPTQDIVEIAEQLGAAYGGQGAYRMAARPGAPLAMETALSVTDEAKAMALI